MFFFVTVVDMEGHHTKHYKNYNSKGGDTLPYTMKLVRSHKPMPSVNTRDGTGMRTEETGSEPTNQPKYGRLICRNFALFIQVPRTERRGGNWWPTAFSRPID